MAYPSLLVDDERNEAVRETGFENKIQFVNHQMFLFTALK